jgi:hypothetical protein
MLRKGKIGCLSPTWFETVMEQMAKPGVYSPAIGNSKMAGRFKPGNLPCKDRLG